MEGWVGFSILNIPNEVRMSTDLSASFSNPPSQHMWIILTRIHLNKKIKLRCRLSTQISPNQPAGDMSDDTARGLFAEVTSENP